MANLANKTAAIARENVLAIEVKKDGLAQLQDGSWVLKLKAHPADMPLALMQAPMGTRYQCALVEVTETDEPKQQPPGATEAAGKAKLGLTREAAIACGDARFHRFLEEVYDHPPVESGDEAKLAIYVLCEVNSRKEFDKDPAAGERWNKLHTEYLVWRDA